jgi:hypothetical protein
MSAREVPLPPPQPERTSAPTTAPAMLKRKHGHSHELNHLGSGDPAVLVQVVAQDGCNRHPPFALPRLRLDRALNRVPAATDVDHARRKVYILPTKPYELAATQARIERNGPQRPISTLDRGDDLRRFGRPDAWKGVPMWAAARPAP